MADKAMTASEFELVLNDLRTHGKSSTRDLAKRLRAQGHSGFTATRTNRTLYRLLSVALVVHDGAEKPIWSASETRYEEGSAPAKGGTPVRPLRAVAAKASAAYRIGRTTVRVLLSEHNSPNDPYFTPDWVGDHILASVNSRHPFWTTRVASDRDRALFLMLISVDAYVHWKSTRLTEHPEPDEVQSMRDEALRHCTLITAEM